MRIKVCGMKSYDNIARAAELGPDFLGLVFWKHSPRYFDGSLPPLPETTKTVGVFVDEKPENVIRTIERYDLDLVQLHGNESPEVCERLKVQGVSVIKAIAVRQAQDLKKAAIYAHSCDYLLFDTKGQLPGGNGQRFDWKLLDGLDSPLPHFLSGGIAPDAIDAVNRLDKKPFALDLNSGFETAPGIKDIALLQAFKNQLS